MAPAKKKQHAASKRRAGLPADSSIIAERTFSSPKGVKYRILTTTERDPYEQVGPRALRRPR